MTGLAFLIAAILIAVFATLGYLKGARWAFTSLLIIFVTLFVIDTAPEFIVATLNGLYMGVMLTLKGGLGDLAAGDLDAVKETLSTITPPFEGDTEDFALLIVIAIAVIAIIILGAIMKTKQGAFGLVWGMMIGYLLAAAVIPLISNVPPGTLPVPLLYPPERQPGQVQAQTEALWSRLAQPQTISVLTWIIGLFLAVVLLLTVRRGVKKG
jgi:hypothetical protein